MRTDRLYAMTLYLLNHGKVSASELAKRYEVSVRTIQRDIDTLCQSGIPIYAITGSNGGYKISDTFTLGNQLVSKEEFSYMATALYGLKTVANSKQAGEILEKIAAVSKYNDTGMILDFSVLREGDEKILQMLQSAIANKQSLMFSYTNNSGETRTHSVEPIALVYRWYSWYLLAYSIEKEDYRTYKLVRMQDVCSTSGGFKREHASADAIMAECDKQYEEKIAPTRVKLHCYNNAVHRIKEYLNGKVLETYADGSAIIEISIVEKEQWWIGVVLSQGIDVKVLEPEHIKNKIVESAKEILFLYQKYDI